VTRAVCLLVAGLLLAWTPPAAAEKPREFPRTPEGAERGKAAEGARTEQKARRTVYVPPSRGSVRVHAGGGTRGIAALPALSVLAPDHVALTTRAQPTLLWFVAETTATGADFALTHEDSVVPVAEITLPGPLEAGVHSVQIADFGVRLDAGRTYTWSIALVPDPDQRDADTVSMARIERRDAPPDLELALASDEAAYDVLARAGIWYDALADLTARIEADPSDSGLRAARANLLDQVGLKREAGYDRAIAAGASGATAP